MYHKMNHKTAETLFTSDVLHCYLFKAARCFVVWILYETIMWDQGLWLHYLNISVIGFGLGSVCS